MNEMKKRRNKEWKVHMIGWKVVSAARDWASSPLVTATNG